MRQVREETYRTETGICPNCKYKIVSHSDKELAECTIEFLKSGIN